MAASNSQSPPRNILIVRVSAIGDVLMASPVARALREAYPDARITWAVEPLSAPLVRANPYVDEVLVIEAARRWPKLLKAGQWGTVWCEWTAFRRDLRARRFDLVVDVHGSLKTGVITGMTRAPRRIGPSPPREGHQLFVTELAPPATQDTHLADRYLAVLVPLGIPMQARRPVVRVPDDEREAARLFLATHGIADDPYVACCIASSRPQKDWMAARWGALADLLWTRRGWRTVLIGGPERRDEARALAARHGAHCVAAAGALSLLQSAAVVQDAVGVVGVDTGLTYAGMAVDTPTVILYGSTPADWLADEPFTRVIRQDMPCAPCRRHPICNARYDCMRAITAEGVADALIALLADSATTLA